MALPQSPPTTSGIVVITGSNSFDSQSSDFPIVRGTVVAVGRADVNVIGAGGEDFIPAVSGLPGTIISSGRTDVNVIGSQVFSTEVSDLGFSGTIIKSGRTDVDVLGRVLTIRFDVDVTQTTVTTSGIVVMDIFVGAGEVFLVPAVGNVRIFPVFQGVFPEQDRRIFPVLPQFSTLTPGD